MVDGVEYRGVITKKQGRKVTVEFKGARNQIGNQVKEFDRSKVHPIDGGN